MLSLYQRALDLRRQHPALGDGTMEWLDVGEGALAFRRQPGFTCVVNLGEHDLTLPDELVTGTSVVLASQPLTDPRKVPSDTTLWLHTTT